MRVPPSLLRLAATVSAVGLAGAAVPAGAAGVTTAKARGVPTATTAVLARSGKRPKPYQAKVAYAVLRDGSPVASARIDVALRRVAQRAVDAFVRGVPRVAAPAPKGVASRSTLSTVVETDILSAKLVGFSSLTYEYSAGAAHGIAFVTAATFNARTGARYGLASLFKPGARYLALLSRESRALLRKRFGSSVVRQMLLPGTAPKAASFRGWALTPFGLRVTFGEYQVAPYAAGTPTILIPFSALAGLARPHGPIAMARVGGPVRMALLPATTPPVVAECYAPAARNDGTPRTRCANGALNVVAWDQLAGFDRHLLRTGPAASARQVLDAVCADSDAFQLPPRQARRFYGIAAAYYGWHFAASPLAGYPRGCPPHRSGASG